MRAFMFDTEEKLPSVFEPHTILPVQYCNRQRSVAWSAEQRLMAAILEDAITVCSKRIAPRTSKAKQVLREALRWLRSNDRTWMFSFLRICETLDLEPTAIRRGIRILRGEEVPAPAGAMHPVVSLTEPPRRAAVG